jgi:uncharacterized membrane protein YbhN (UPF0104 family)
MQEVGVDPEKAPAQSSRLQYVSFAISAILILGGAFVMYQWISGPEILTTVRHLDWRWLVPALIAYWLQYPISAYRMSLVIYWLTRPGTPPPPSFRLILKLTLSAGFISVTAPVGLLADAAKIGALKYFGKMSTSHAIRCTLFDRVVAAQWMSLFALATLPLQWGLGVPLSVLGVQLLVSAGIVAAIVVLLYLPGILFIFDHRTVHKFAHTLSGYEMMFPWRRSAMQMAITAVNLTLVFASLYCLLRAAGLTANLAVIACFTPFLQIVNSVPFLYMGWGGREIAMAATVGVASGLSLNQALAISATWGITLILASAINGIFMIGDWHSHRMVAPPPAGRPPSV